MSFFQLAEQLKEPYQGVFKRVYLYVNVQEMSDEESNDAMLNLYDVLFTAQSENRPVEAVVGEDIEVFCRQYFDQRKLRRFITSIPDRLYRMGRWLLAIELFFLLGDSLAGQVGEKINLLPYLLGLLVTLLMIPIGHLGYHFLIGKARIKTEFFYGLILTISIFCLIGIVYLSYQFNLMGSRFWTIGIVATYVLPYQLFLFYQNRKKFGTWYNPDDRFVKEETKQLKKQGFQVYFEKELHKTYAKGFRKHIAKGKTSESFYQKLEKDLQRDKLFYKWFWLVGLVLILISAIPIYLNDPLFDALIYTIMQLVVVNLVIFFVTRMIANGFPAKEHWLQEAAPYRMNLQEFFDKEKTK